MALMCVTMVLFGFASSWLVCRSFNVRYPDAFPQLSGLLMVAVAFPNTLAVPLSMMISISDHPLLVWEGSTTPVEERATSLFLFSYVIWVLARWSIGDLTRPLTGTTHLPAPTYPPTSRTSSPILSPTHLKFLAYSPAHMDSPHGTHAHTLARLHVTVAHCTHGAYRLPSVVWALSELQRLGF
jgi:hypothetical protein